MTTIFGRCGKFSSFVNQSIFILHKLSGLIAFQPAITSQKYKIHSHSYFTCFVEVASGVLILQIVGSNLIWSIFFVFGR